MLVALIMLGGGSLFASGQASDAAGPSGSATTTPVGQYPIATDVTLDIWLSLNQNVSPNYTNLGDTPFARGLQERTGVKLNFLHPPSGGNAPRDQLNLMIAAADLPDIVEWNWIDPVNFPGGPEKGIADGTILRLNDIITRWAPNLRSYLSSRPDYDRMVKTDEGSYYTFPFIRDGEKLLYSQGLMIRKDWLDDLNLAPPNTLDEFHTVLTAFKNQKNCQAPFTMVWTNNQRMFVDSFGILKNWYVSADDGRIHLGIIEPPYRRWAETMARWYREGLIDPDIMSIQTAQQNTKMTNGTAGSTVASGGSGIGTWTPAARATNPRYEIIAIADPVERSGQRRVYAIPNSIYSGQDSAAISGTSKNVEIAARFLDWGYSQAGHMFYNFGIEGESYTMVGGKAAYSPQIMRNPRGWPLAQSMSAYVRSTGAGPFIQNEGYVEQYYELPEQKQLLINYVVPGASNYILPPITATQEESRELNTIMQDINTFVEERMARFILGTDAITDASWNDYVNTIQRMNVTRALAIQNAALDRYKRR